MVSGSVSRAASKADALKLDAAREQRVARGCGPAQCAGRRTPAKQRWLPRVQRQPARPRASAGLRVVVQR